MRSILFAFFLLLFAVSSCNFTKPSTIKEEEIIGRWALGQQSQPFGHPMVIDFKRDSTVSMMLRDGTGTGNWSAVKSTDKDAGPDAVSEVHINYTRENMQYNLVLSVLKRKKEIYLAEGDSVLYGKPTTPAKAMR